MQDNLNLLVCSSRFQDKWLTLPEFENWLEKGDAIDLAYCKKCQVVLQAGKSELLVHAKTKKHVARMGLTSEEIVALLPPPPPEEEKAEIQVDKIIFLKIGRE